MRIQTSEDLQKRIRVKENIRGLDSSVDGKPGEGS